MAIVLVMLFIIALVVVAITLVVWLVRKQREERDAQWRLVGRELGLNFFPSSIGDGPALTGEMNGFPVTVDIRRNNTGDQNSVFTRYTIRYPASGAPPIRLTKQQGYHSISFLKRLTGTVDVTIGDAAFDDRVLIQSTDPVSAAQFLSPIRRQTLLQFFALKSVHNQLVSEHEISFEISGVADEASSIARHTYNLLELGRVMSEPTEVDRALEERHRGPMDQIAEDLTAIPPPAPPKPVGSGLIFTQPDPPQPPDPDTEPAGSSLIFTQPDQPQDSLAPLPEPAPPEPTAPEPEDEPESVSLDAAAVATDLFDSTRMGFEIDARFDAVYAGATVQWSGTVDSVRDYRSDSTFDGPGRKVTVILDGVGDENLRSTRAQMVAQLAREELVVRGDEVLIMGTLVRADRFTRTFSVANSSLV